MRSRKSSSSSDVAQATIKRKPKYDVNSTNKKKRKSKTVSVDTVVGVVDEIESPALPFYDLTIQNVVSTFWVGDRVGLRNIQLATQGRLDTTVFPSCVSRALEPLTTNSIFDSGRVLITGAKSEQIALYAGLRFVDKLNRELHTRYQVLNFMVQNMVSSFCLGFKLNIDFFYYEQKCTRFGTAHYDPSKFRGCSYKPKSGLSFVVFQSGKCVLTGAKTWEQSVAAYTQAVEVLARYRLGHEYKEFDASKHKRARTTAMASTSDNENTMMKIESDATTVGDSTSEDDDEWHQFIDSIGTSTVHKELTVMAML